MLEKPRRTLPDVSLFFFGNAPSFPPVHGARAVGIWNCVSNRKDLKSKSLVYDLTKNKQSNSSHRAPYKVSPVSPMNHWDSAETLASPA